MASAILPSRNDPRSSDFMTKFTDSNLNFTRLPKFPNRNSNPNPNPNPNSSHFVIGNNGRDVNRKVHQHLPSSINSVPANSSGYRYITFRLDSYTKRELKSLKKRLISDLERVRTLRQLVYSASVPNHHYHPPPLELQPVRQQQQKRTKPLPPVRDTKKACGRLTVAQRRKMVMRECGQVLGKLMKHKHGWVFNTPVNAAALKLYDYHNVINNPMDLGTIKSKLLKNEYDSPFAFASDVRLTFENAMVYNGRGSDVFAMAERLLLLFEDMFNSTSPKCEANQVKKQNWTASVPISVEKPVISQTMDDNLGKGMMIKPLMTAEEKSELAESLMNLPLGPEGMHHIMAIVKKGAGLEREGDEIELDLGVLDNDTLWELHGLIRRTLNVEAKVVDTDNCSGPLVDDEHGRQRDAGEEYVDIGEEMQLTNFPSVEIERDVVNGSGSSGSDSSSDSDSSSSDSGSGTSYNEHEVNPTPKES